MTEYLFQILISVQLAIIVIRWRGNFFIPSKLLITYWLAMIVFGILLFPYGLWVTRSINESLLSESVYLFVSGLLFFVVGVLIGKTAFGNVIGNFGKKFRFQEKLSTFNFRLMMVILAYVILMFGLTFVAVGYIPAFAEKTHISKYFQEDQNIYIAYRPFYVSAMNFATVCLGFSLAVWADSGCKRSLYIAIAMAVLLALTGKRGQLLIPMLCVGLGWLITRKKLMYLPGVLAFIVIFAVFTNLSLIGDIEYGEDILAIIAQSFFVDIRELTRVLTIRTDDYLYGATYLAGLISFIPTELSEFKSHFNYMRYLSYLEGSNPDDSGGMRASYLGEALINFGYSGIVFVSIIFGLICAYVDKIAEKTVLFNRSIIAYTIYFSFVQLVIFGFFENGSSFFLFALTNLTPYYFLYRFQIAKHG